MKNNNFSPPRPPIGLPGPTSPLPQGKPAWDKFISGMAKEEGVHILGQQKPKPQPMDISPEKREAVLESIPVSIAEGLRQAIGEALTTALDHGLILQGDIKGVTVKALELFTAKFVHFKASVGFQASLEGMNLAVGVRGQSLEMVHPEEALCFNRQEDAETVATLFLSQHANEWGDDPGLPKPRVVVREHRWTEANPSPPPPEPDPDPEPVFT